MALLPKFGPGGGRRLVRRIVITAVALGIWFWTQSLIGHRSLAGNAITDVVHQLTSPINAYLLHHAATTDALLIVSSAFIDAFGLFLLCGWLFGSSIRPFLSLLLVMALRQLMQGLCALPVPQGMIWHNPGFPSLLVTYTVANDFFFSGHTAIAVVGVYELARLGRAWLAVLGSLVLAFEVLTVLSLRVHYTMDVFTGIVTALLVCSFSSRISGAIDRRLEAISRPKSEAAAGNQ